MIHFRSSIENKEYCVPDKQPKQYVECAQYLCMPITDNRYSRAGVCAAGVMKQHNLLISSEEMSAVPSVEWEECMSKKHSKKFWFNKVTGESRWSPPDEKGGDQGAALLATEVEGTTSAEAAAAVKEADDAAEGKKEISECPSHLSGKRDFLFRGFEANKKARYRLPPPAPTLNPLPQPPFAPQLLRHAQLMRFLSAAAAV